MNYLKRYFLVLLLLFGLTAFLWAKQREMTISVILPYKSGPYNLALEGFKKFWAEQEVNIRLLEHNLAKEPMPELVFKEIEDKKTDIVLTIGSKATHFANKDIKNIPVVFSMILTPVTGTNITGVSLNIPSLIKINYLKKILPNAKRIGVLYSSKTEEKIKELSFACAKMKLQLIAEKVESAKDFPTHLKKISPQIDCFWMIPDSEIFSPQAVKHLLIESIRNKFPVMGLSYSYVKAGALFSLDGDYEDLGEQAGMLILRILSGEKVSRLPPEPPRKINLFLNQIVAEKIGIEIPAKVIQEATSVIKK